MVTPMQLESADERRMIWEETTGDERFTLLIINGEGGPLGNHAHLKEELFVLIEGDGVLYTRPVDETGIAIAQAKAETIAAPCIIQILAGTAHTFSFAGPAKMISRMAGSFEEAGMIRHTIIDPATGGITE